MMDGTNHCVTQAVPMVSHIVSAQCILWVLSECVGRHFSLGSGPKLFVCSGLWLGSSIMVLCLVPLVSKEFFQSCVRTWHPIFQLFSKTSVSVSCTSYQHRMPDSGRRMLDTVVESSLCVQVCICTLIQKKSHP